MRDANIRLSRIGGALLVIAGVLAVALHLSERARTTSAQPSVAAVGTGAREIAVATEVARAGALLDCADVSDRGRVRLLAHAVIPQPATRSQVESELKHLAHDLYRENPAICAMMILAYSSQAQRVAHAESAPWVLVWSPDGLGWDGRSRSDFEQHIYHSAAE